VEQTWAANILTTLPAERWSFQRGRITVSSIIYLVGLIVVVMAILSFIGLR
jgi:hypothetical protein